MKSTTDADLKFDGYVQAIQGQRVPCDVQIWLPRSPADDATISVFLSGPADAVMGDGGVRITSNERVELQGLKFLAEDVLIRSSKAQPGFREGGAQLTITHIGRWVIHHVRKSAEPADDQLKYVKVLLSALRYGAQPSSDTLSYVGTREVKMHRQPQTLRFSTAPGAVINWELQKHWDWKSHRKDDSVSAHPTPVLCLADASLLRAADLPQLRTYAEDACLLLSLAARHRTAPHVLSYATKEEVIQEWRYPLERTRSRTEEEATGPLIAEQELESFFERASTWWSSLDECRRDAVRLAVFAIHGTSAQTLEATLMSRFAALEGLTKRWASGKYAADKFEALEMQFPFDSGGLWPMHDKTAGVPLYWFRNEIAHGRTVMRFGEGLSLASDHMQLWLERVLLALMEYHLVDQSDWLSQQVAEEQSVISRLRAELALRSSGASGGVSPAQP